MNEPIDLMDAQEVILRFNETTEKIVTGYADLLKCAIRLQELGVKYKDDTLITKAQKLRHDIVTQMGGRDVRT